MIRVGYVTCVQRTYVIVSATGGTNQNKIHHSAIIRSVRKTTTTTHWPLHQSFAFTITIGQEYDGSSDVKIAAIFHTVLNVICDTLWTHECLFDKKNDSGFFSVLPAEQRLAFTLASYRLLLDSFLEAYHGTGTQLLPPSALLSLIVQWATHMSWPAIIITW